MPSVVGKSIPRSDGPAKVTGSALYVDDLSLPGMLFGATLRSRVARGRLRGISWGDGEDGSGVTLVTAADVAKNEVALIEHDQPILAASEIRHCYEPIALLACGDPLRLARALAALRADVEELPPVLDPLEALAKGDVMKRYRIVKGDAVAALASCEVVLSGRYSTHHQEQLYIEPQGVIAWWDDKGAHVLGSLQCPYYVQKGIKAAFDLPDAAIEVTQTTTGGGFGGKEEYPTLLALHALLLAKKSGRPVKMVYDRQEDVEATTKRHPCSVEITSGCDRDGTLRALVMKIVMDGGAYVTLTPVVLSRGTIHAAGAYRWDHVLVESAAVFTNTPPNGAFRGFGAPQTIWAIERHLDRIARELALDPLDLKSRNTLRLGDHTATGQLLTESVGVEECVEAARRESGWDGKRAAPARVNGRKARGIGAAVFMHGAGFTGSGETRLAGKVAVDVLRGDGGLPRLAIRTASTDIGQGTETVFRQIAADAAGLPIERVEFAAPSTANAPDSGPTVASRTVMIVGGILEKAAKKARACLDAGDALPLTVEETYETPRGLFWDDETYSGDAYPVYAWACDIAEVEVDLDTFETKVLGFWAAQDVGRAINPVMCKGQIEGGTLQAIGWALNERVVWKDGRILNGRMTNYIVPTALDAPPFTTSLVEAPYSRGPGGGAKGIGELPMDGGAPAIAAAIEHATGLVLDDLPLLPEDLFRKFSERGA